MRGLINPSTKVSEVAQKKVSSTSSNGPPRNYCGALEVNLKACAKGTKLRVYNLSFCPLSTCPIECSFSTPQQFPGGPLTLMQLLFMSHLQGPLVQGLIWTLTMTLVALRFQVRFHLDHFPLSSPFRLDFTQTLLRLRSLRCFVLVH